jgi:hypothetical protein
LFTNNVSPGIANLIRIIESAGRPFHVVADRKTTQPLADHDLCYPLVFDYKKKFLHAHSEELNNSWSVLFFTWAHWVPYSKQQIEKLGEHIRNSSKIILLYDASFGSTTKRIYQQIRDLRKFSDIFSQVNEICYLTEYPKLDAFSLFRSKYAFHTSSAVNLTFNEKLSEDLYKNYNPKIKRSYWCMISGNYGTAQRQEVIQVLDRFIEDSSICSKTISKHNLNKKKKICFWAVGKSMLPIDTYFETLRNSNFTLCLPGSYWTPRPFEAFCCGSIPILEDRYLKSYDIPFEDGKNCVVIEKSESTKSWSDSLRKTLTFSENKISAMRWNIYDLRKTHLLPDSFFQRQRKRLSL